MDADLEMLRPLHPDIVVLSETGARPNESKGVFIGSAPPCLAVFGFNGYNVSQLQGAEEGPALSATIAVSGATSFTLAAWWPVPLLAAGRSYSTLLTEMSERLVGRGGDGSTIVAGDFNSSTGVSGQEKSHPAFVAAMTTLGLSSVYHHHSGEAHGSEAAATFVQGKRDPKPFHIDYCFVRSGTPPCGAL